MNRNSLRRILVCWLTIATMFTAPTTLLAHAETSSNSVKTESQIYTVDPNTFRLAQAGKPIASKTILLTFDDTPFSEKSLNTILKVLKRHKVKAIFFVNGYLIEEHPFLLKKMDWAGHEIGNHSFNHSRLIQKSRIVVKREIVLVQRRVKELTGQTPRFFRPPYGDYNKQVLEVMKIYNLQLMNWSNDPADWHYRNKPSERVTREVMNQLKPGQIVLLHDLPGTSLLLDKLLSSIKKRGYQFAAPEQIQ